MFRADADSAWCVAFSPDGTHLAYGSGSENRYPDITPGTPLGTRYVAGGARGTVSVCDLRNGRTIWSAREPVAVLSLAFSPDGRTLAAATGWTALNAFYLDQWNGSVKGWHVATGEPAFQENEIATLVSYTTDGRLLTASSGSRIASKPSIRSEGKSRPLFPDSPYRVVLGFDPHGGRVSALADSSGLNTYDPVTGKQVGSTVPAQRAEIASCGRRFCALYAPGTQNRKLDVRSLDGGMWHYSIVPTKPADAAAGWSADGRFLATADTSGEVKVWDVERGAGHLRFYQKDLQLSQLGFSPDSARLATASYGVVATKEKGNLALVGTYGERQRIHTGRQSTGKPQRRSSRTLGSRRQPTDFIVTPATQPGLPSRVERRR